MDGRELVSAQCLSEAAVSCENAGFNSWLEERHDG